MRRLASELQTLVPNLATAGILCVGDVMLDRYIYGEVERISPEAPIPVLRIKEERAMLGGAGNVARNLAALGAKVLLASVTGADDAGTEIAAMFTANQCIERIEPHIVTDRTRRSTVKTRYVSMNHQMLRADFETSAPLDDAVEKAMISHMDTLLPRVRILVLSDYGKGVLTRNVCRSAIEKARKLQIPVIVDPKGVDYEKYRGASIITPNRKELAEASGRSLSDFDSIVAAAKELAAKFDIGSVLVTLSQDGMALITGDGTTHLAGEAREVFDVSGAGDTAVATLAAGLGAGLPLVDAASIANTAAGIAVGKVGTAVVHPDELAAKLHERELASIDRKVVPLPTAWDIVEGWRARGLRIGFTNGCFDLLHPGHVSLLAQARAQCDRLVVGLNSDASVARLKGPKRPIQPDIARGTVLASLASVDLVVVFEEDTPERLIEGLKPDVLIKGGDYSVETIAGAAFVQSYGGRVAIIDLVPGFSTSKTVERMNS